MILHPDRDRILTVREVARLQSFADNFVIEGTGSDQHQQLANAVPPLLGKAIAETLARNLDTKQSKYTFIDLFAGMGGFRLAFEAQGCKCVFSSEIDKFARDTNYFMLQLQLLLLPQNHCSQNLLLHLLLLLHCLKLLQFL